MDKKVVAVLLIIAVAFGGYLLFFRGGDDGTNGTGTVSNHVYGKQEASVALVEYADFQCPACAGFGAITSELKVTYRDQVSYTFRHFPIDTIHPNARAAHRAAEAAGRQGKFFEMHDLLFQNQQVWGSSSNAKSLFDSYASQLGLDITTYDSDFMSDEVNATINADVDEGKSKGVDATPTFFLNGTKLDNNSVSTLESFSKVIDDELAKSAASQAPADQDAPTSQTN